MPNELKPCPFCGSHAQTDFIEGESYIIECYACEARTDNCDGEVAAIDAWNRRATPPNTAKVELPSPPKSWGEQMTAYYNEGGSVLARGADFFKDQEIDEWRAWGRECASGALASRPAGEVELPPLPPQKVMGYDAFDMTQYARAALASNTATREARDAARWRAFRKRDEFDDLDFTAFKNMFREDADKVIDAAIAEKESPCGS